ncbi:TPA: ATP-binding protein [Stenotrophomonas maltophilia]
MRPWPKSISGQLLALWVFAILAAHLIAVVLLSQLRSDIDTVHPLSVRMIEARTVSAYRAIAHASNTQELLNDITLPGSDFGLEAASTLSTRPPTEQERALEMSLRERMGLSSRLPIHVRLSSVHGEGEESGPIHLVENLMAPKANWVMDIEVAYPDGQWLRSHQLPTMMPAHWKRVLSFSLLVGIVPSALIAFIFGRRIMRPLRALTEASRQVSRGERVVLPDVHGPDDLREITKAFNEMQENLLRFVQGRTQMIAAIGHDLRTPLTSLRIRAELIDDKRLRDDMIRTLDEMSSIVSETLEFSREDAVHEQTEDVTINALVRDVCNERPLSSRSLEWKTALEDTFVYRCRPVLLKRALNNLVDNATRYGNVRINCWIEGGDSELVIEIEDDGPGIDPALVETAFQPFSRLDSARNRETGGAGLGLAIARTSARAHGGEITLSNIASGGLRARVSLPL